MEISRNEDPGAQDDHPDAEPQPDAEGSRRGLSVLDWSALMAVVAGGLNCGLIAAVNLDVAAKLLPNPTAARVVYGVVGLAALHCVVLLFRLAEEARDAPG